VDPSLTEEEAAAFQEAILRARDRRPFSVLALWARPRPRNVSGSRIEVIEGGAFLQVEGMPP